MALIRAGILSKMTGKCAGIVGGTWKGKNYVRELVKPSNPNTPAQRAQRSKMGFVVKMARAINGDVLRPYLTKQCKEMSAYNWFCRENIKKASGSPLKLTASPVTSFGTLGRGKVSFDSAASAFCATFDVLPAVPAGHTLKGVVTAFTENGELIAYGVSNVSVPQSEVGDYMGGFAPGNYDCYFQAFFAELDANGQVVDTSPAWTSPKITCTVDE